MLAARYAVGHLGDLSVSQHGDAVLYAGARRGGDPSYHLVVRPGDPIQPSHRDIWLTGRWRAYTRRWGILFETPVEHEPWPLFTGVIEQLTETLTRSTGLPAPNGDPVVHFSTGVRNVQSAPLAPSSRTDSELVASRPDGW